MTEKEPRKPSVVPVPIVSTPPPIHDKSYEPPPGATTGPGDPSPLIEKPPFEGGDETI